MDQFHTTESSFTSLIFHLTLTNLVLLNDKKGRGVAPIPPVYATDGK